MSAAKTGAEIHNTSVNNANHLIISKRFIPLPPQLFHIVIVVWSQLFHFFGLSAWLTGFSFIQ
jgi:hypothetical protein